MLTSVVNNGRTVNIIGTYKTTCASVKITSKHKQSAQIEAERVFNAIATKCDKKPNGFIKKIKSLK